MASSVRLWGKPYKPIGKKRCPFESVRNSRGWALATAANSRKNASGLLFPFIFVDELVAFLQRLPGLLVRAVWNLDGFLTLGVVDQPVVAIQPVAVVKTAAGHHSVLPLRDRIGAEHDRRSVQHMLPMRPETVDIGARQPLGV